MALTQSPPSPAEHWRPTARQRDAKVVEALDNLVDAFNDILRPLPEGLTKREVEEAKAAVVQAANKIHRSHGR